MDVQRQQSSLECQWACQSLFLRFMQCLDASEAEAVGSMVSPDVVWVRQGQRLVGVAAICRVFGERPPDRMIRHHLSNIVITLEGRDKARSKAYYAVYAHEGLVRPRLISGPERVGDYHAEYVRTDQGWRISHLRAERLFTASNQPPAGSVGEPTTRSAR